MIITMNYGDFAFEVELRYVTNNGKFVNEWCHILTCDMFPGDTIDIQSKLTEHAKLTGIIVLNTAIELP